MIKTIRVAYTRPQDQLDALVEQLKDDFDIEAEPAGFSDTVPDIPVLELKGDAQEIGTALYVVWGFTEYDIEDLFGITLTETPD